VNTIVVLKCQAKTLFYLSSNGYPLRNRKLRQTGHPFLHLALPNLQNMSGTVMNRDTRKGGLDSQDLCVALIGNNHLRFIVIVFLSIGKEHPHLLA
jgi:hypothetical protein